MGNNLGSTYKNIPNTFVDNIEKLTLDNKFYRKVIFTGNNLQLVLMNLKSYEEIGNEKHDEHDQFIRIESGEGLVIFNQGLNNEESKPIKDGTAIVIPAGLYHNIKNTSNKELKLYSIYAPPEHKPERIDETKKYYHKYMKYKNKYKKIEK